MTFFGKLEIFGELKGNFCSKIKNERKKADSQIFRLLTHFRVEIE